LPVGNDVVDLRDPGSQPDAIHPRFDARVFTDSELRRIAACPDDGERHVTRWTLWAAKESVLKLVRQQEPAAPFRPREFSVRLTSARSAEVSHESAVYAVDLDVTEERVHAVARDVGHRRPVSGISRSAGCVDGLDVSALVRARAARSVGERLGIEPDEIEIRGRIPRAMRNGERLPVDISLSHHGRYLAVATLGA
jgi:phosphopantetheinyl transferase (holo-ACP synthase)